MAQSQSDCLWFVVVHMTSDRNTTRLVDQIILGRNLVCDGVGEHSVHLVNGEGNVEDHLKPEQDESEFKVYGYDLFCVVFHRTRVASPNDSDQATASARRC